MRRNLSNLNSQHTAALRRAARKARPKNLVPKILGKSAVDKGPWRCELHKKRVVACGCLVPRRSKRPTACDGPVDPHHPRKIAPAGWGQPSDALVVPLCRGHHDEAHEGPGGELGFQERHGIDFARWIERFSAPGAAEIAKIRLIRPHI